MKIVRFTGRFANLIPNGWIFQKLFARNYRQYHKICSGEKYGQKCRIWQHHKGYLEIDDLFNNSWIIVSKIIDGTIKDFESQTWDLLYKKQTPTFLFKIDAEKSAIYPYHSEEYAFINLQEWHLMKALPEFDLKEHNDLKNKYQSLACDDINKHLQRFRSFILEQNTITMLQEMVDKNWLKIEEVTYKS